MRPGLHVSGVIVPNNRLTGIPVRVMNVRLESMFIKSRTTVANLHLLTVVRFVPKNVPASKHKTVESQRPEMPQ